MIRHRDQILLNGLPLFTKIGVETPLREDLFLPSEACYLYIEKGDGHSLGMNITATAGTVILSTCGLTIGNMITNLPKGSLDSVIIHFKRELILLVFENEKPALWEELNEPVNQYVVQNAASELVKFYFDSIAQLFHNKAALTDSILKLKLKEIILLLLQTENSEPVRQIIKSLFSERTFSFKELIDAHIRSSPSIENLAMITNCSVSTFKRRFKKIYHTTPNTFIINQKVERVANLLKVSDESISNIGYECGFNSPEHLSRVFKKKYGISPSKYRLNFSVN